LVAAALVAMLWKRTLRPENPVPSSPPAQVAAAPNADLDTTKAASSPASAAADTAPRAAKPASPPADAAKVTDVSPAGETPRPNAASPMPPARIRAVLNRVKAQLNDPDAVAVSGNGDVILREIWRVLPQIKTRADSVEANYYLVETNLILDRPVVACRILARIRGASRGTSFEAGVDRFLGDPQLDCASRR
jgi:hypothetical protein